MIYRKSFLQPDGDSKLLTEQEFRISMILTV